jgi:preprotein translocase subunit SecE
VARDPGITRRLGTEAARRAFSLRVFGEVVAELRRVTWPNRQETLRLTLMVLGVSATVGVFLFFVDLGFRAILDEILLRN